MSEERQSGEQATDQEGSAMAIYGFVHDQLFRLKQSEEGVSMMLQEKGLDPASADKMVRTVAANKPKKNTGEATRNIIWGLIWCVGGIVGTLAEIGYVFWGAIIFGGIQLVQGLSQLDSE